MIKEKFEKHIYYLQDRICSELEAIDSLGKFEEDIWKRPGGGGGKTRILNKGKVFEKGGVNVSVVHGDLPQIFKDKFKKFNCKFSLLVKSKKNVFRGLHFQKKRQQNKILIVAQGKISDFCLDLRKK